jgi:hypothetical protein
MPMGCLDLLIGCLQTLQKERQRFVYALEKQHGTLASAWMRFVSTYRSSGQIEILSNRMSVCRCSEGPPVLRHAPTSLHSVEVLGSERPGLPALVNGICIFLSALAEKRALLPYLYRTRRPRRRWPHNLQDLIPFERTSTLHALSSWLPRTTPMNGSGSLINLMLNACGPYWLKPLLTSPALLLWMCHTTEAYNSMFEAAVLKRNSRDSTEMEKSIKELAFLAGMVQRLCDMMFDDELLWWVSNLENQYDVLAPVVKTFCRLLAHVQKLPKAPTLQMTSEAMKKINHVFSHFVVRVVIHTPRLAEASFRQSLPNSVRVLLQTSSTSNPHITMMKYGFSSPWTDRCYGPSCSKTAQQCGYRFAVCSGCQVAAYCSRRCQRTGWRYAAAPHRQVCDTGRRVKKLQEHMEESAHLLDLVKSTIDPVTAAKVARNFKALHESQVKQLRECALKVSVYCLCHNLHGLYLGKEVDEYVVDT